MRRHGLLLLFLYAMVLPGSVWSISIAELQAAHHLEVSSELLPADGIVPGQRLELTITIATDGWFSGGTRLEIPEVPGLVILQTDNFASNSSESRDGQSWVIQRWVLNVFPQRPGNFTIPPVTATVKLGGQGSNTVEGKLRSPELRFRALMPDSLARAEHWVAAPRYKVSQSFDKDLEKLKVGDAFDREVRFEATDVMAMMLPAFEAEKLDGLTAYQRPPTLSNNSNRGDMVARRVEHISYIVEAQGRYQLPARDYFWWDTRSAELQIRFLPAIDITIGPGQPGNSSSSPRVVPLQVLVYVLALLGITCLIWLVYKRAPRLPIAKVTTPLKRAARKLNQMRKPALPENLNPDNSAGE